MRAKNQFIKKLQEDQEVHDTFVVLHKQLSAGRTGRNYLRVTLGDRTGQIETRVWEGAEEMAARFTQGDPVYVTGIVTSYQGVLQVKAHFIETLDHSDADKLDWAQLLPAADRDLGEMWEELRALAATLTDPHLRALVDAFVSDEEFGRRFRRAPAAKMMHHAYIGGLLQHTLACMKLADVLAPLYALNRDLLVTGAFLHDIGKMEELRATAGFDYTDEGRLLGHIMQGVMTFRRTVEAMPGFPADLRVQLEHMILSHHGEMEWGSPKRPKTMEALALHAIDNIDAKIEAARQAIEGTDGPDGEWTPFVRIFDRQLFKGRIPPVEAGEAPRIAAPPPPAASEAPSREEFAKALEEEETNGAPTPQGSLF